MYTIKILSNEMSEDIMEKLCTESLPAWLQASSNFAKKDTVTDVTPS